MTNQSTVRSALVPKARNESGHAARQTGGRCRAALLLALVVACSVDKSADSELAPGPQMGSPAGGEKATETSPTKPAPDDSKGSGGTEPVDADPESPWAPPVETAAVTFPYTAYRCGYAIRQVSPSKREAIFHDEAAGKAPAPRNLHLTIAGNAATSIVIQWATDAATKQTEVRFGAAPDKLDKVARGYSFASGNRRQHEVHLCGLAPSTTLYYDAGGSAARSKVHKVTTAPDSATEVTLLVGGDTRSNPSVWGGLATAALAQGPTALLLSGDAVATGGDQGQWDALFESAPDLFAELPALWAHGNHEALEELYFEQFALPDNGGAAAQIEQWFATTYGPLRIVVLNDTVSSSSQLSGSQKEFLEATLNGVDRARTPFVVAMHHKPMYTTSASHESDTNLRRTWGPLFDQYKVDVDIAGHVHSYESTHLIKAGTTTFSTSAGAGTRFFNFGGGGAPLYDFSDNQGWIKTREKTNGFAILKVDATKMTWTAFRRDGSTIESIVTPKQ